MRLTYFFGCGFGLLLLCSHFFSQQRSSVKTKTNQNEVKDEDRLAYFVLLSTAQPPRFVFGFGLLLCSHFWLALCRVAPRSRKRSRRRTKTSLAKANVSQLLRDAQVEQKTKLAQRTNANSISLIHGTQSQSKLQSKQLTKQKQRRCACAVSSSCCCYWVVVCMCIVLVAAPVRSLIITTATAVPASASAAAAAEKSAPTSALPTLYSRSSSWQQAKFTCLSAFFPCVRVCVCAL